MKRKLYETLGVEENASTDDIKKAHRKKAMQTHPDRAGGNEEEFKQVQRAYEVLSNPAKRRAYDETGDDNPAQKSIEQHAREFISQMLHQLVQQDPSDEVDLVEHMKKAARDGIDFAKNEKRNAEQKAKAMERQAKRLKRKNKGHNLLQAMVLAQASMLRSRVAGYDRDIELANAVIELLADYECEVIKLATAEERHQRYGRFMPGGFRFDI